MNQQTLKTARISSCSTKKSSTKPNKSQSKTKKNLQSTFTKMSIPNPLMANSSVLTQRINTHNKCKAPSSNPESQNTLKMKSSNKKIPKTVSQLKTDRKVEYTKLKAKQMESQLEKKPSSSRKNSKKSSVQVKPSPKKVKPERDSLHSLHYDADLGKISNFVQPQSDNLTKNRRNSDELALSEISKNQKQLIEKISSLEKQNITLSQKNDSMINEIKYKHEEEVLNLKEELKILSCRLNQQSNKNEMIEKKSSTNEKEYTSLREKLLQKDQRISYLQKQNKSIDEELRAAKISIKNYETEVDTLQSNIKNLNSVKTEIVEKLKKCQKEKQYIKENCTQVLAILREQFGNELKIFSF